MLCLQLFLSLVSFPILISWGLPFSLLSPIGNCIFSPFIIIFLFFSSLFSFFTLIGIPTYWISWCLNSISSVWLYLLTIPLPHGIIFGCGTLPIIILLCVPFGAFFIVYHTRNNPLKTFIGLLGLCACIIGLSRLFQTEKNYYTVAYRKQYIHIFNNQKDTLIIDPGIRGQIHSIIPWVHYTLLPTLIKSGNKLSFTHLIIQQPTQFGFLLWAKMLEYVPIKTIYYVPWKKNYPDIIESFELLQKICSSKNTTLTTLEYDDFFQFDTTITMHMHTIKHPGMNKTNYSPTIICYQIDNHNNSIYAATLKKKRIFYGSNKDNISSSS